MSFVSLLFGVLFSSAQISAQWKGEGFGTRILAPYLVMHPSSFFDTTYCIKTTGLQYFTLSHINADKNGNPAWLGKGDISLFSDYVTDIRNQGGDVIVSFGGSEGGNDLALVAKTSQDLAEKYQSVIDLYNLSSIDVDVYGSESDSEAINKRFLALASIKEQNPELRISVTLSVNSTGFNTDSLYIFNSLLETSFVPDVINLLTLDFEGEVLTETMGSRVINAATGVYSTIQESSLAGSIKIGISPMIGQNDVLDEIFDLTDADLVNTWAKETEWLELISFWSINRDNNLYSALSMSSQIEQTDFGFTLLFMDWQTYEKQLKLYRRDVADDASNDTIPTFYVSHPTPEYIPGDPSLPVLNETGIMRSTSCTPLVSVAFNNPGVGIRVQNWNRCTQYYDTCNPGYVCCIAPGDSAATCRMSGQASGSTAGCASQQPPIPNVPANALPPCAVNFPTPKLNNPLPLLPPAGSYYFGIWWDNDDGDSPQNVNSRLQMTKNFPIWQMNIPMSSTSFAVNYFDQIWTKAINLNTNALFFISIFPSCILPHVSTYAIETLAYRLKAIIDTGRNVWVRYAPEMNGNWNAYQQDPINYVIGYQNFVRITRAITGTSNINFVWAPNVGFGYPWGGVGDPNEPYGPYYPGDSFVDMVGLSIYHFGVWQNNGIYANSEPTPRQFVTWVDSFVQKYAHKPFVVAETAGTTNMAAQDWNGNWYTLPGSDAQSRRSQKQNWWRQLAAAVPLYPTCKGIMIFDYIKYEGATWRDFTVSGGTPGMNSPLRNDGAALDGPTASAFQADINNGVLGNVLWASPADTPVPDWYRCQYSTSTCATSSFICCHGSASDLLADAKTCRPPTNCYGVSTNSVCNSRTDVCSAVSAKCCAGSAADYLQGVTKCLTTCYTPIAQWNDCNYQKDSCATYNDQCCYGSATDLKNGKSTCRPASNCYTAPVPVPETTQPPKVPTSTRASSTPTPPSYTPIPQWNDCNSQKDLCATSGDFCCFGSADDFKSAKTTCRPSGNCYKPPPLQPDASFQGGYNWADKIFAPFIDVSVSPAFDVVGFSNSVGSARYIFGFITAGSDGTPAWSGTSSIKKLDWLPQMQAIRLFGGDAIISLGGPSGTELALRATTARTLQINYQNVLDGYNVRWLDFFLAGAALTNQASIELRNQVLRAMQTSNPNLMISYTLPATSAGLTSAALDILTSAANYGVRVDVVNMLTTSTSASTAAAAQLQQLGLTSKLGLTPTIGIDSTSGTNFQIADGTSMVKWAKTISQMRLLSIWNANRDSSVSTGVTQRARQFSQTFVQYEN